MNLPYHPFPVAMTGMLALLLGLPGPAPGDEAAAAAKHPPEEKPKTYDASPWRFSASAEVRAMEGDFDTGHDISITQLGATVRGRREARRAEGARPPEGATRPRARDLRKAAARRKGPRARGRRKAAGPGGLAPTAGPAVTDPGAPSRTQLPPS